MNYTRFEVFMTGCKICSHEKKVEINEAIVKGDSQRVIAGHFNVSQSSVGRHKTHVRELIDANEELQADKLAQEIKELQKLTIDILEDAMAIKDKRSSLQAIKEARSNIELIAKLSGAINERVKVEMDKADTTIKVIYSDDWLQRG